MGFTAVNIFMNIEYHNKIAFILPKRISNCEHICNKYVKEKNEGPVRK